MSKLTKGIIIGALASGVLVGMFVPMGAERLSVWERIKSKKDESDLEG